MLTIRLSRTGKRNKPQYRIVLQEKGRDPWSPAIEILGNYNPHTQPSTVLLKEERITHWLGMGAQPSETVQNMLINAGIMKGDKAKSVAISKKRAGKMEAKATEAASAKKEANEKKKAEAEAKKVEEEAAKATEAETPAEAPAEEKAEEAATEEKKEEEVAESLPSTPAEETKKEPAAEEAKKDDKKEEEKSE
jgi:small subunit ribosomal protein S16